MYNFTRHEEYLSILTIPWASKTEVPPYLHVPQGEVLSRSLPEIRNPMAAAADVIFDLPRIAKRRFTESLDIYRANSRIRPLRWLGSLSQPPL